MGAVHEGWDRELERKVAIKVLPAGHHDAATRARFVREAKLLARVQHPNVVAVFDVGIEGTAGSDGDPFIVMELLAGDSLRAVLQQRAPLEWRTAAGYARDIARALGAIHAAGLVHRDVKPANAMRTKLSDLEVVKLLDLGVARAADEATLSKPGAVVGTVLYIAPEQIRGGEVEARADLYSLGATLFELLQGKPPFFGPTAVETIHAHLFDPPPKISAPIPAELSAIVMRCLAKKSEDRFPDARAVERALDGVLGSDLPAAAAPVVVPQVMFDLPELAVPERMAKAQAVEAPAVEPPALEVDVEVPSEVPLEVDRPEGFEPLAIVPVHRELPAMSIQREEPSALAGIFTVLPAPVHRAVALGATLLAVTVFFVTQSWLVSGALLIVAALGLVGFFLRRKDDGYEP